MEECRNCKYWIGKSDGTSAGDCRRYAPRPGDRHGWPRTNPHDWCGEWVERDDARGTPAAE